MRVVNPVTSFEDMSFEMGRREVNGPCSLFAAPCYGQGVGAGQRSEEGRNVKTNESDLCYFARQDSPD